MQLATSFPQDLYFAPLNRVKKLEMIKMLCARSSLLLLLILLPLLVKAQKKITNDLKVKDVAEFAVNVYNVIQKKKLTFESLVQGEIKFTQIKIYYLIVITAKDESQTIANYEAIVLENVKRSSRILLSLRKVN